MPTTRASVTNAPLPRQWNFEAAFLIVLLLLDIACFDPISHNHRYDNLFDHTVNIWVSVWVGQFRSSTGAGCPGLGGRQQTLGHNALSYASDSSSGGGVEGSP
jgi:hypothetical protein